jgi:integrase/recombinase XerC
LKANQFPLLLHAFFHDWLVQQRNVSHHTVLSYRDSWRLFLRFVAAQKTKSVARLGMDDLTAVEVLAFLKDIEQIRKSSIGTRNCRLSALHSFYRFVADREPLAAAQCAAVLRIPTKQAPVVEVRDLDEDEISAILAQPNRLKLEGQRDHVLLAFLYNTGARIQEALDLSVQAIRLESPFQVRLFGKERHSYCISFRRRNETTIIHACRQACDLAFSLADSLLVVRTGIGLDPCTHAHRVGRVWPMCEPFPA